MALGLRGSNLALDKQGSLITDNKRIMERWREYMEEEQQAETIIHADLSPEIKLDEVRHAITRLKYSDRTIRILEDTQLKLLTRL